MSQIVENLQKRLKGESIAKKKQTLKIHSRAVVEVKVSELKAVIESNPEHPVCESYAQGIQGFHDNHPIFVEKVDLEAILQNKTVLNLTDTNDAGETIQVKQLGDVIPKKFAAKELPAEPKK